MGLLGNCAEVLPEIVRRGIVPDLVTDQTSAHDPIERVCTRRALACGGSDASVNPTQTNMSAGPWTP